MRAGVSGTRRLRWLSSLPRWSGMPKNGSACLRSAGATNAPVVSGMRRCARTMEGRRCCIGN
jgi:hypothetical protein